MYSVKKEREAITESSVLFHKHGACTAKHHLLNTGLAIVQIINGKSLALSSAKEVSEECVREHFSYKESLDLFACLSVSVLLLFSVLQDF